MVPNYGPGDSLQTETPFRVALVIVFGKPHDGLEFSLHSSVRFLWFGPWLPEEATSLIP